MTNRFYSAIIDYADLRGCWNRQTGKLEVLVSVLACGFKSHFPHQCKGHSIFRMSFIFISRQISKLLSSKKATLESHEIFDLVVEETRFLGVKSMILRKRNLFRRLTKASPRCPIQYWRVGSSPISRTSVKDIRFSSVLYFYISANQQSIIIEKSHTGIARNL